MKIKIYCIFIFIIFVSSCKNKNISNDKLHNNLSKYYTKGNYLIRETYDSSERIILKSFFNKDTIHNGAEISYYPSGKIEKWKWIDANAKYANCVVYYDTNGVFDTFVGNPFIKIGTFETHLILDLINPPNVNFKLVYKDSVNNKLCKVLVYDPILTDSLSYVNFENEHKFISNHKYMLYFVFINKNGDSILGKSSMEIYNPKNTKSIPTVLQKHPDYILIDR